MPLSPLNYGAVAWLLANQHPCLLQSTLLRGLLMQVSVALLLGVTHFQCQGSRSRVQCRQYVNPVQNRDLIGSGRRD